MNQFDEPIRSVLVVGGGTAGWMTAAYLVKAFGDSVKVTLLEAPTIAKIGVGEATVPNLQKVFFDFLGIPEETWMQEVNGSFKTAVKFVNWRKKKEGETANHFYHPFGILPNSDGIPLPQYWYYLTRGQGEAVDYACFREPPLMDAKRSPKFMDGRRAVPHAWHFDAHLVADFLRRWATERGVVHVLDEVKHVTLSASGTIGAVHTTGERVLTADLFVDCTGFRGLLINKALGEPFIDMSGYLLCDSAVAAPVRHDDEKHDIEPYTSAIAMKAGWTWKIPMLSRFGTGYVYSSKFASVDEATRDFSALWGLDEEKTQFNKIRFRTGRNRRAWVGNCVSIGLSSCFLEPLESTGIYFITASIYQLAKHFPTRAFDSNLIDRFNREIEFMFDDSRDFIQAHYLTSTRDDSPFWLANKNDLILSDNIKEKIAIYRSGLPVNPPMSTEDDYYGSFDNEFHNFWTNGSYYCIFSGMGSMPDRPLGRISYRPGAVAEAQRIFMRIRDQQRELVRTLPSTYQYLRKFHEKTRSVERSPVVHAITA
jgi:2-polyprenyl-6-methoxyphenol hydroxylase-like FAD-dependent oxidoreductase